VDVDLGSNNYIGGNLLPRINYWMKKHRTRISGVFGILCILASKPTSGSLLYGVIFILAGESIRIWSSGHIHKNQILTVTGPYSLSRNPLYVGSFILGTGFMVSMGVIWLAVVFLLFFASVYWFTIRWEEDKLANEFPGDWEAYKRAVPRFLPVLSLPEYHAGEFSWSQVKKYKEIPNASVVLAAYAILWAKTLLLGHG
jgi:protein-S-isoprenylcysteine O-methyltransferase Ste14